ncbi:glutamyl/glutaminyl-tRNA synthetase [Sphingomonas sp. SORGH_AS 950]|nr:glutamyl/glutaminyl-tRNA synthetase [Sphingomonas sp. SORGH_AS_0950]
MSGAHPPATRPVTRFAPSPTGRLHLGHALSAVRAHDLARAGGGRFLLRIEDIDGTRSRPEHVDTILRDLEWLGLEWDDLSFQSERLDLYAAAQARLADLLYPCFCTRAEIAASLSAPHGAVAVYPGTCRHLPPEVRAARMAMPHGWRLDMARAAGRTGPLSWQDDRAGIVAGDPLAHGDVILARKDAPASYHLAVTVDDAAQGVTHCGARGRPVRRHPCPPAAPGAARPADAALSSSSADPGRRWPAARQAPRRACAGRDARGRRGWSRAGGRAAPQYASRWISAGGGVSSAP